MTSTTDERLLTVADLAERHGVSKGSVYRWNSTGTGPRYTRVGAMGGVRYRLSDVLAWEQANSHGGEQVAPGSRQAS